MALTATGHPGYSQTHPRAEQTGPRARNLLRTACTAWGLSDEVTETAALVLAELVSNAVRHGIGPSIRLLIARPSPEQVRLAVVDRAPLKLPEMREPGDGESGRGLILIDSLSDQWGYDRLGPAKRPWGKRVWADLRIDEKDETAQ
ncbi:ATP-binding protein [Streptomyces solisilvae]|uniref:ATP-binding protein n=1 Tax=Streptomyces malaysiensis TaxID=92644 RepID=UPI0036BF9D36